MQFREEQFAEDGDVDRRHAVESHYPRYRPENRATKGVRVSTGEPVQEGGQVLPEAERAGAQGYAGARRPVEPQRP